MYCTFTVWLETLVNSKYLWFSTWVSRLNMLRNIEEATRMQLMFFLMVRNIFKIWWKSKDRVCIQRTEFTQIKLYLFYSVILFISLFMYLNPGFWSSFFLVFFQSFDKHCCALAIRFLKLLSAWCGFVYSKHPHIRTHDFGGQADWVLIYRVLNDKSASKCS